MTINNIIKIKKQRIEAIIIKFRGYNKRFFVFLQDNGKKCLFVL